MFKIVVNLKKTLYYADVIIDFIFILKAYLRVEIEIHFLSHLVLEKYAVNLSHLVLEMYAVKV